MSRDKFGSMNRSKFPNDGRPPVSDLAQALRDIPVKPILRGPRCTVGVLLDELNAEEADALEALLQNELITLPQIVETLYRHGHKVGEHALRRHRRRSTGTGCACPVDV